MGTSFDYFPNAGIVGADITPATKRFERGRVSVEILDQSDVEQLTLMAIKHAPFDIVIEDGSHPRAYGRSIQLMMFDRHACLIKKQYRAPEYPLAGSPEIVGVSSGEDCRSPSGTPLCGPQIDFRRR